MTGRARWSVSAIFLIHGMIVSNWISRIPAIQTELHLKVNILGLALLGASAGALLSMSMISRPIRRVGSARVTRWSTYALCATLPLPALARGPLSLTFYLFIYGAAVGAMEIAMNTQAVDVERASGKPVMVGFHALFSVGGMLGAAAGGFAASRNLTPRLHLAIAAGILAFATTYAARGLLPARDESPAAPTIPKPGVAVRPLVGLAAIAFCILLGEGAMADWSAVYLSHLTGQGTAAAGYSVFSLLMALGRLSGDWLRAAVGSVRLVRLGSGLAAAGLGAALLAGNLVWGFIGFALAGAGWSAIFPIVTSAAGHKMTGKPEAGVAVVSSTGYFAFLVGPPVIGFLAEASTLRSALAVVVVLSAVTTLLAGAVRDADAALG